MHAVEGPDGNCPRLAVELRRVRVRSSSAASPSLPDAGAPRRGRPPQAHPPRRRRTARWWCAAMRRSGRPTRRRSSGHTSPSPRGAGAPPCLRRGEPTRARGCASRAVGISTSTPRRCSRYARSPPIFTAEAAGIGSSTSPRRPASACSSSRPASGSCGSPSLAFAVAGGRAPAEIDGRDVALVELHEAILEARGAPGEQDARARSRMGRACPRDRSWHPFADAPRRPLRTTRGRPACRRTRPRSDRGPSGSPSAARMLGAPRHAGSGGFGVWNGAGFAVCAQDELLHRVDVEVARESGCLAVPSSRRLPGDRRHIEIGSRRPERALAPRTGARWKLPDQAGELGPFDSREASR